MLIAEAHVQTEHPSRYLVQLCRHAQQAHRLSHRPRGHDGDAQAPPEVQHVEWSETRGTISFGWGRCTMQATQTCDGSWTSSPQTSKGSANATT